MRQPGTLSRARARPFTKHLLASRAPLQIRTEVSKGHAKRRKEFGKEKLKGAIFNPELSIEFLMKVGAVEESGRVERHSRTQRLLFLDVAKLS